MHRTISGLLVAVFLAWVTPAVAQGLEALGIRVVERPDAASESSGPRAGPRPSADALPDGETGYGVNDVAAAWLVEPTRRYDHGVLGDAVIVAPAGPGPRRKRSPDIAYGLADGTLVALLR